ncbi:MAG: DUF1572 domain-containing protein [Flavisolibacter sp.]
MNRTELLAGRMREVFLNGRWIANTNYNEQLQHISWQDATRKFGPLNTIAALTFHINYYLAGLLQVFGGGALEIRDKYSFDLPPITSEEAWQQLRNELLANAEAFADAVEQLPEDLLDKAFVDEKYGSYLRNIEGVIEHGYYHLGQISLIRKLLAAEKE